MVINCDIDDSIIKTILTYMDKVSVTGRMEAVNLVRTASVLEQILTTAEKQAQAQMQSQMVAQAQREHSPQIVQSKS